MAKSKEYKKIATELSKENQKAYVAVGEYIIHFEMMLNTIKKFLKECAAIKANLDNDKLIDILLHDSTASSLLSYYKAFVHELFPEQMQDKEVTNYLKLIFKEVESAYQKRNDIAHATYKYGFYEDNPDDFKIILVAEKFKVYKEGLQDKYHRNKEGVIDYVDIRNESRKLMELNEKIDTMIIQIGSTQFKLSDQEVDMVIPKSRKKRMLKKKVNLKEKDIMTFE